MVVNVWFDNRRISLGDILRYPQVLAEEYLVT